MAEEVLLEVDGREHGGWKTIQITRSLETISGTFELGVSELWPGSPLRREVGPGARCTVYVAGEPVITGWVDDVKPAYDAGDHSVSISGRDATGDLVDCAAVHKPGVWHGRTLEEIAAELCRPFGIAVRAEVATAPFPDFKLQEGETVFESLERGARQRAVLLVSDGLGGLLIARRGRSQVLTPLVLGQNVIAATGSFSFRDRFSDYTVKGQQRGTDDVYGDAAAQVKGTATDPGIARYRPFVVIAEQQASLVSARDRAQWEANFRAARARKATYTVRGWRSESGLWRPNQIVRVHDEWIAIATELLISGVTFRLDDGSGELADLEVVLPEAYDLVPLPARGKKSKAGKGGAAWGSYLDEDPEEE